MSANSSGNQLFQWLAAFSTPYSTLPIWHIQAGLSFEAMFGLD